MRFFVLNFSKIVLFFFDRTSSENNYYGRSIIYTIIIIIAYIIVITCVPVKSRRVRAIISNYLLSRSQRYLMIPLVLRILKHGQRKFAKNYKIYRTINWKRKLPEILFPFKKYVHITADRWCITLMANRYLFI